jgi:hypothetical protein
VLAKLRWMNDRHGADPGRCAGASGEGIDIRALLAESLHMGDEGHNRNKAGSILYTAKLAPLDRAKTGAPDAATAAAVSSFLGDNALSVLNPVMAACKAMADAGHGVEGSTIMTHDGAQRHRFGHPRQRPGRPLVHRAGADAPDGLYFPGFSCTPTPTRTSATARSPRRRASARLPWPRRRPSSPSSAARRKDAVNATLEMYEITVAEHKALPSPAGLPRHADGRGHSQGGGVRHHARVSTPALRTRTPGWGRSARASPARP